MIDRRLNPIVKNRTKHVPVLALVCLVAGLFAGGQAAAQSFSALYNFMDGPDGGSPQAGLVQLGNTLYGVASTGGSSSAGTVFSVNTNGMGFSNLYSFTGTATDGGLPYGALLLSGGVLYGTASADSTNGAGCVYSLNTDGTGFNVIYAFNGGADGSNSSGGLVMSGTTLYGTTAAGGSTGYGTVFAVNTDGTGFTTLHTFGLSDGAYPQCTLVLSGTTLYGTTPNGGAFGYGTTFKVSTTGTGFTTLNSFNGSTTGSLPYGGLVLSGTNLYGTTYEGGVGYGIIFKISTSGTAFSNLYSFSGGSDGAYPFAGLYLSSNTLYGTTFGGVSGNYGTVFSVSNNGTGFASLHGFINGTDGGSVDAPVILTGNTLYGTTFGDGIADFGTIYKVVLGASSGLTLSYNLTASLDITKNKGNEIDPTVAVNPNSSTNVFVAGVCGSITNGGLITSYTSNLTTWTTNLVAAGGNSNGLPPALGQPSVAWDSNSNLFLAYVPTNTLGVAIAVSTNGGQSFFSLTNLDTNDVVQYPRIVTGAAGLAAGNVWIVYKDYTQSGTPLIAQGLVTTNTGSNGIGAFSPPEIIPNSGAGGFPDIAIGPSNQVIVAYQNNVNSAATSQVFVSINTNLTTTNGFGAPVSVTTDAIGGQTYIPAEPSATGVNAGVGLAWDVNPASAFFGRLYLTYSVAQAGKPNAINVEMRYSVNYGASWSAETQINDDANSIYSHFFPRIAVDSFTGSVALCWYDCRKDTGTSGDNPSFNIVTGSGTNATTNSYTNVFDLDGKANDDFMVYSTASLNGGASFSPNMPLVTIWNMTTLAASNPPSGAFTYVSEAAKANNSAGIGHHIAMAYSAGNAYPVWTDNSGFAVGNPDLPALTNFDFDVGYSVLQTANLGIIVSISPTNPLSGQSITYSVIITNLGPFTASSITVTNNFLDLVTLVGQPTPAPNGTYAVSPNGQTIIFNYLSSGTSLAPHKTLTNTFVISENTAGFVTNVVTLGSSLPNPNPAALVQTNIVAVGAQDMAVGITASPTNIVIGGSVTYTVNVTNLGPAANGTVFVTNILTANMNQITNVSLPPGTTYTLTNNTLVFNLGFLTNQGTAAITYSATALSTKTMIATNTAIVTSTDFDTNSSNNISQAYVTILGEDLGVTISSDITNANIGDTITYTVNVTNNGPSDSGVLVLTNTLTSNLGQINLVQLPPGFGSVSRNVISFNMGMLGVGQGITIVYTAVALSVNASATNAISTVVVSSTDFDTNLVNNTASTLVTINGEDLALGLNGSATSTALGQVITYTETVTNLGPSYTGIVNITNTLSGNLFFNSVVQAPGAYFINGQTITFQIGALALNQTATVIFTALASDLGTATVTGNTASSDFDTNLLNNVASFSTTIFEPPPPYSNFTITALASAAFFTWDTPYPSTGQVLYGLTPDLPQTSSITPMETHHVVLLTGLTRDTNYYYEVDMWEQGNLYTIDDVFATVDTLILNTGDASYTGSWLQGPTALPGYYGNYFNVANTTPFNPTASAVYSPTIPAPGYYNISMWYPQATNFATNTQVFAAGATNVVIASVNQMTNGGKWFPLVSNLYLATGNSGTVTIYNDTGTTNRQVAANAMKWAYNPTQDYPTNRLPPLWWTQFYYGTNTPSAASNYAAYVFGAAPGDPSNTPNFWLTFPDANTVMVTFTPYLGGRNYYLQTSTNLARANGWVTLTNQPSITTDGNAYGCFIASQTNAAGSFYRISASIIPQ
jgi:uncharacterized repeat protein (TIGR01451 family)